MDYRNEIIQAIEHSLIPMLNQEQLTETVGIMTRILNDYEITERCTELALLDDVNEKLLKRYAACMTIDGKSAKTISQYTRTIQKLSDSIGRPFTEIGTYDIRYFLACEKQRGVANSTLENTRSNLSAFFSWLTAEELIQKSPMTAINPIKCPTEIRLPFSDVEIDALRGACRSLKDRALIEILLSTGVRVDELSQMEIPDVDLANLTVLVKHAKGGKERTTYMSSVCRSHLTKYLGLRKDNQPYLFVNKNYKQITTDGIRYILDSTADRAGVANVHPHRFRRTFATGLAARGMDIQEIQKLLGHSKVDTTLRYIFVDDSQVQASYRKYIA